MPNRGSTIGQQLATRSTSMPVAGQEIQIVFVTEPDSQAMARIADAAATGVPPQIKRKLRFQISPGVQDSKS
jgi:hypothetical protein